MKSEYFVTTLQKKGFYPWTGVPDSIFQPVISYLNLFKKDDNIICSSEGEAMGLAGGLALAGRMPVVYMQNDGYGNAVNPLSSLQLMYELPALILISWRAEPGTQDEPQHLIMGKTILELLDCFEIPYSILEDESATVLNDINKAEEYCRKNQKPYAFIIKKNFFEKFDSNHEGLIDSGMDLRHQYIETFKEMTDQDKDLFLGTTGYTGRELLQIIQTDNKFYMTGSMGCLASIGLGLAREFPQKRVFVLDGDGAVLMKMGTLSTVGYHGPKNFIHICFNNGEYESTGGQKTSAGFTKFTDIAMACGYKTTHVINSLGMFKDILKNIENYSRPHFMEIKIPPGTLKNLERPAQSPVEMKRNFQKSLKSS
ncbi:MAG: phosphonopyruvate decarboxylase [Candidatus Omnitrophica bacterium]|nr:phosphonopyruvate decarboxylase [Candidatus Omnitrophota bacterium]